MADPRRDYTFFGLYHCLLAEDEADIEARLRAKYANIRFVEKDYGQDSTAWKDGYRRVYRQPPDLFVPYLPSLVANESQDIIRIWLQPDGWEPEWQIWPESGDDMGRPLHRLANEPPYLRYLPSRPREGNYRRGSLTTAVLRGDRAHMSFAQAVGRIFKRHATNVYDAVYDDTGNVAHAARRMGLWTGAAAQAWCAADPARRLERHYRPAGVAGGPFPRGQWGAGFLENPPVVQDANES